MNAATHDCPLEYTANLLGGKWKMRLLWAVHTQATPALTALADFYSLLTRLFCFLLKQALGMNRVRFS